MVTNCYLMNRVVITKCSPKCLVCGKEIEIEEETVSISNRYNTKFYHKSCYDKLFV